MTEMEKEILEGQDETVTESTAEATTTEEAKAADETTATENTDCGEKKSFGKGKKKDKKEDKKEDAYKQKIDELEDRVKRQMAEFENFRKRTEKEKAAMYEVGAKSVIEKMLPVVDNFERGLAAIPEAEKGNAFAEGMNMIYKQLMGEFEKMGVKPIEAVGTEFNPDFHNAVMQVASDELESGMVAQELLKGYTYNDSVVRHSMVAVVE